MREIVVAKYKEDLSWLDKIDNGYWKTVVTKGVDTPNKGREITSFLYHIINRYSSLAEVTIFCQGNPFDHATNFLEDMKGECNGYVGIGEGVFECDGNGSPHHTGLDVCGGFEFISGSLLSGKVSFIRGGQFMVSKEVVLRRSLSFYESLFDWVNLRSDNHPWVMERLWSTLFNCEVIKNGKEE